jgi:hypothetical protein
VAFPKPLGKVYIFLGGSQKAICCSYVAYDNVTYYRKKIEGNL